MIEKFVKFNNEFVEKKEYEKYVQTDEYIKETAEDKLGLVNPNEIIFKPSNKNK